jgi:hypothetical protein
MLLTHHQQLHSLILSLSLSLFFHFLFLQYLVRSLNFILVCKCLYIYVYISLLVSSMIGARQRSAIVIFILFFLFFLILCKYVCVRAYDCVGFLICFCRSCSDILQAHCKIIKKSETKKMRDDEKECNEE